MEIPDPFPVGVLSPFFMGLVGLGTAVFFYLLIATDWIPKPDMEDPRERAFMVVLFILILGVFIYLLYVQIFMGGVLGRWFPW